MPFCEVEPGVRLYYEAYGHGEPFLFIHGGGMSHEAWEQQSYSLTDDFRVVTVDLRGHGESDKPADGHTFERLAKDMNTLIAYLDLGPTSLVCHGVGGYVGILITLNFPHLVKRLCLVNSGARFMGSDAERGGFSPELWSNYKEGMKKDKIEATRNLIDSTFFFRDPGPAVRQRMLDIAGQWPLYATKMLGRDMEGLDLDNRLSEIHVQTLIMHGAHDKKQRFSGADHLRQKIAGAKLVVFENSAHNPQAEEVEKFNKMLKDFAT